MRDAVTVLAQMRYGEPFPVWPAHAGVDTGLVEATFDDGLGDVVVRNVTTPTLTPVLPDASNATGTAVVVAPGGAFRMLSWKQEGTAVAERLARHGIAAFVLKYRLVDTGPTQEHFSQTMQAWLATVMADGVPQARAGLLAPDVEPLAEEDGRQAVRVLRQRAGELGIDPRRIGLMGFSAGAFVATAAALGEDASGRPDFVAAIYGGGLQGPVTSTTPPLFSVVAGDDLLCRDTCFEITQAWLAAGLPAELHVYERGGHGFGARTYDLPTDAWFDRFTDWLALRERRP